MSSFCFKHKVKKIQNSANTLFFLSGFSFTDTDNSEDSWGREGDHLLFHSTTSTRSRTLRHLFATLHVRWLSRIFNRNACVYQTACYSMRYTTLLNCHLIDWLMMQCLFVHLIELILGFCYSDFDIGNRGIWARIGYHPCITSEPTNQVC